jgi:CRISPR-associated exonuclease Cas4
MLDNPVDIPFRVIDLKQWGYCPRVLYYHYCLPDVRPVTYKMQAGIEAGRHTEEMEERRSLRVYGLSRGTRQFNVALASAQLGLRGVADMVIDTGEGGAHEVIPVDFKDSEKTGPHFALQLAAYALMLEEVWSCTVRRGFLYLIPLRRAEEVPIDRRLRVKFAKALNEMLSMLNKEAMPAPTPQINKCVVCEFRRFCNDIL